MKKNEKIKLYESLFYIREVQEQLIKKYRQGNKMRCPMHFCIGQEMLPAVLRQLINKKDSLFCGHRSHGYYLSKNGPLNQLFAEFYGKKTGVSGGMSGSQEMMFEKINFYSGALLSGSFAMSIGDAFSKKYNSKKNLSVAIIGDGGMDEGISYEVINMAVMMKLPVLFICENNLYSTQTHMKERNKNLNIYKKLLPYGIKTSFINSNNPEKCFLKIKNIIKGIKSSNRPVFLEVMTYRFNAHVGPETDDHYNYRSNKEINLWKKKDPLNFYKNKLIKEIKDFENINMLIKKKIKNKINNAFKYAEQSKFPNSFEKFNYQNTYSKKVKNFYNNQIPFDDKQEEHKPKASSPY